MVSIQVPNRERFRDYSGGRVNAYNRSTPTSYVGGEIPLIGSALTQKCGDIVRTYRKL
nr:MAG TPA: hypothetical protein [Caudoviricetes sp.]